MKKENIRYFTTEKQFKKKFGPQSLSTLEGIVGVLEKLVKNFPKKERKTIVYNIAFELLTGKYSTLVENERRRLYNTRSHDEEQENNPAPLPVTETEERYSELVALVDTYSRNTIYNFQDDEIDLADRRSRKDQEKKRNNVRKRVERGKEKADERVRLGIVLQQFIENEENTAYLGE